MQRPTTKHSWHSVQANGVTLEAWMSGRTFGTCFPAALFIRCKGHKFTELAKPTLRITLKYQSSGTVWSEIVDFDTVKLSVRGDEWLVEIGDVFALLAKRESLSATAVGGYAIEINAHLAGQDLLIEGLVFDVAPPSE
jgi:hypothetical protein